MHNGTGRLLVLRRGRLLRVPCAEARLATLADLSTRMWCAYFSSVALNVRPLPLLRMYAVHNRFTSAVLSVHRDPEDPPDGCRHGHREGTSESHSHRGTAERCAAQMPAKRAESGETHERHSGNRGDR